jgi:agmatinase
VDSLGDAGDIAAFNTSLERMREEVEQRAAELIPKHHMLWLGGDHGLTLSLLRAYKKHFGRPLAVLHFDAHCDTWTSHYDEPSGHGTWVYEAFKEELVVPSCFTQVGIRSSADKEARDYVEKQGGIILNGRHMRGKESIASLSADLEQILKRYEEAGRPPIYLTLDIDVLDPAYAPGTGTPEPGGLSSGCVLSIIEELVPRMNFVGMDCVEVSPPYDHAQLTSQAAAHFVWTYLCAHMQSSNK